MLKIWLLHLANIDFLLRITSAPRVRIAFFSEKIMNKFDYENCFFQRFLFLKNVFAPMGIMQNVINHLLNKTLNLETNYR